VFYHTVQRLLKNSAQFALPIFGGRGQRSIFGPSPRKSVEDWSEILDNVRWQYGTIFANLNSSPKTAGCAKDLVSKQPHL
jgi:hypothetical protein